MNIHRNSIFFLVAAVLALLTLGFVMLSSTAAYARESGGNVGTLVQKQGVWLGIGVVACVVASLMDYDRWRQTWWVWFTLAVVLLALCFVPHVGHRINGAARWLKIGSVSFQPSELAKLAGVFALAWWFSRDRDPARTQEGAESREKPVERRFIGGFVVPLGGIGILLALIAPEVDMGTTALLGLVTFVMMFVAGTRWRYLLPIVLTGVTGLGLVLTRMPERLGRLLAFLYPDKYPDDAYQQVQGLIALGSGGVDGLGLGMGRQKMEYLPFAHTDFIFPVVGEELGLPFTLGVVFAYVVITMAGCVIAMRARDRFGMLLGLGLVAVLSLQAVVNIGVTTMMLPNKGMPLPFISYGGSNLILCLVIVGILINIWRKGMSDREVKSATNVRISARIRRRPVRI